MKKHSSEIRRMTYQLCVSYAGESCITILNAGHSAVNPGTMPMVRHYFSHCPLYRIPFKIQYAPGQAA